MKKIAHAFLMLVGLGAAVLRWIDLANFTDAETGFVTVGSVWWRYGLVAVLMVLAVLGGFMASRRPKGVESGAPLLGVFTLLLAGGCAMHSGLTIYVAVGVDAILAQAQVQLSDFASLGMGCLGLFTALWLCLVAFAQFGKNYRLPAGGVCMGLLGNLYFYMMLISRFASNQSSFYRLEPTMLVFSAVATLWFMAVLLRALYYPESNVGRKLYRTGMLCFYLNVVFTLPQVLCDFIVYQASVGDAFEQLLFAGFGVFGALIASRALSEDIAV